MTQAHKTGVLLVNLGTPDSPGLLDVFRYLNEFLTDARVIDLPWAWRQLLVRGVIIPRRVRNSAKLYQKVWTEQGSPLLIHSQSVRDKLQAALGDDYVVSLGMRYQKPSLEDALCSLQSPAIQRIIVLPMFPQYASATTGSIHEKVMQRISQWLVIPELQFINSYPTQPQLIQAFVERGQQFDVGSYDHCLFSFHGLPERHLTKADACGRCLKQSSCCSALESANQHCYRAQCYETARALADALSLKAERYNISFQSRLGKEPWTQPYTEDTIRTLAQKGCQRLLVFAPAFTCDCLETIDEIGREYAHLFTSHGGLHLQLVPSVNDHPLWIQGLQSLVTTRVP